VIFNTHSPFLFRGGWLQPRVSLVHRIPRPQPNLPAQPDLRLYIQPDLHLYRPARK
jgi:hypothetical protein